MGRQASPLSRLHLASPNTPAAPPARRVVSVGRSQTAMHPAPGGWVHCSPVPLLMSTGRTGTGRRRAGVHATARRAHPAAALPRPRIGRPFGDATLSAVAGQSHVRVLLAHRMRALAAPGDPGSSPVTLAVGAMPKRTCGPDAPPSSAPPLRCPVRCAPGTASPCCSASGGCAGPASGSEGPAPSSYGAGIMSPQHRGGPLTLP